LKQNELIEKTFSKEFVLVIQIYEQFSAFFWDRLILVIIVMAVELYKCFCNYEIFVS
jgi:hypothetical protein